MSDPVSNAEIEDVLSSIRRLVSEDARPKPVYGQPAPAEPEKLVLTPSLRIKDDDPLEHEQPAADLVLDTPVDDHEVAPEAPVLLTNPAPTEPLDAVETQAVLEKLVESELNEAFEENEVVDQSALDTKQPIGLDTDTDTDPEQSESDLDLALPEADEPIIDPTQQVESAPTELKFDLSQPLPQDDVLSTSFHDTTSLEIALTEGDASEEDPFAIIDPAPQVDPPEEDALDEAETPAPEPQADSPDPTETEEAATEVDLSLQSKIEALQSLVAKHTRALSEARKTDADEGETAQSTDDTPKTVAQDTDVEDQSSVVEAPFPPPESRILDWEDHRPEPSPELVTEANLPHEPVVAAPDEVEDLDPQPGLQTTLTEAELREMVAEIVRQELKGALGERITRNVRKLVRREIHRVMMSQELD